MKKLLILSLFAFGTEAFGWGREGHSLVAQIAQDMLTPGALAQVENLLNGREMAEVSSWADQVRDTPQYKHTAAWHFADIDDGESYESSRQNPSGDLIKSLKAQLFILSNHKLTRAQRAEALKFVIHFMGDIHQPLHIGRPGDQGGNAVQVSYQGRLTNLHSLWDHDLVEGMQLSAQPIEQGLGPSVPYSDLVEEAMSYRKFIYSFKGDIISESYAKKARSIVTRRLQLGGERLARALNQVLN